MLAPSARYTAAQASSHATLISSMISAIDTLSPLRAITPLRRWLLAPLMLARHFDYFTPLPC
jgi:hypothetical protein